MCAKIHLTSLIFIFISILIQAPHQEKNYFGLATSIKGLQNFIHTLLPPPLLACLSTWDKMAC